MAENFYTILTNAGKAKIANATALGTKVNFTTLKVGDGNGTYYNPTETQEDLVRTVWQGNINSITTDPENPSWIVVVVVLPSNVGGFTVREVGIFDDEGDMLAIGKYPETYKPVIANGSVKDINIRMILEVTNNASVTLKVDPTVTLATKEELNALTGAGRTTETIKGNADAIVALDERVTEGIENSSSFDVIKTEYTADTEGVSIIPIGHSLYTPGKDDLKIFYKNEKLNEGENYNVSSDHLSIELIDWTLDVGVTVYFELLKKSIGPVTTVDGALIDEGTIGKIKLSQDLQDEISGKASKSDLLEYVADSMKLGQDNKIINKVKALELKIDTRTTDLIYTNKTLTNTIEKDGTTTVKTTTLNYDVNGNLTSVVETAGGCTVTTTLNYDSGQLSNVTKAVV